MRVFNTTDKEIEFFGNSIEANSNIEIHDSFVDVDAVNEKYPNAVWKEDGVELGEEIDINPNKHSKAVVKLLSLANKILEEEKKAGNKTDTLSDKIATLTDTVGAKANGQEFKELEAQCKIYQDTDYYKDLVAQVEKE